MRAIQSNNRFQDRMGNITTPEIITWNDILISVDKKLNKFGHHVTRPLSEE